MNGSYLKLQSKHSIHLLIISRVSAKATEQKMEKNLLQVEQRIVELKESELLTMITLCIANTIDLTNNIS